MERNKSLAKNIIIFAIGSFSSKLLQFLLIPFYTRVLTNSEYGTIDILQSTAVLLMPIISLTISEAVFRYTMDENSDKQEILSIGIILDIINIFIMSVISIIIFEITKYEYILIMFLYISTNIIRTVLSQFTRAIEKVGIYTLDNVLNILITIISNIILLTVLHQGVNGFLLGYVIGNCFSILLLLVMAKLYKYIKFKKFNVNTFKKMLRFSIPLIPTSVCWWIISSIDRWMIAANFGSGINGIYAVSHKVPTILTIIMEIFFQAWQISANKEFDKKDISNFYSDTFKYVFAIVFMSCALLTWTCKLITKLLVGAEFMGAWYYMPVLLLGTSLFSMAQFLDSIYTASKNTKMAFVTNMVAAIVNIILNIVLLKTMGPIGVAIATAICYSVLWIYRAIDTRKTVKLKYNFEIIIPTVILSIINTIILTLQVKLWYIYSFIIIVLIFIVNIKYISKFLGMIIKMMKEKMVELKR